MSEHDEQVALFQWAEIMSNKYPELKLMYAIPNGGYRHIFVAKKLKAEGTKSGVPDICLPVPRGEYHGLYIELKRKGGCMTSTQKFWLEELSKQGYRAECCICWDNARKVIEEYLNRRRSNNRMESPP